MSWNTFVSSGGIRSDKFKDYDTALKHFNSVKPIRGREVECRPLGHNRGYTQCAIEHDPLTQTVSAVLYGTKCVTIGIDGVIKITRGDWISPTTVNFIDAVLPSYFGSVYLKRRKIIYKSRGGKEYEVPRDGLDLQASPNWEEVEVVADQPTVTKIQYEYKADRKVMNKLRAQYSSFLTTVNVMSAMSDSYGVAEYAEYFTDIADLYIKAENEHNADQRIRAEKAKKNPNPNSYLYNCEFNGLWNIRSILATKGLPPMSRCSDLAHTSKVFYEDEGTNSWIKEKFNYFLERDLPLYMQALNEAKSEDVQTQRRLMLKIVANGNEYARGYGYGNDEPKVRIPAFIGEVDVPDVYYNMSALQIENYFIDIIKYVYADKIFRKVEVPSGTMPSTTNEKYVVVHNFLAKNTDIVTSRHVVL